MRALITGIGSMDGSYLSEYLLDLGWEVHGIIRRHSVVETQTTRIDHIIDGVNLYYGDMTDVTSLENAIIKSKPDRIFHLAAMSHVKISFDMPNYTFAVNANGTLTLLELMKKHCPMARLYNAASSEMFGTSVDADGYQRETTEMNPASPYGISKLAAYNFVRHYRRAYGLHASNGILFNHESPRRSSNFVTQKVAKGAVEIKIGKRSRLELGNLDSYRDWGHSRDYVRMMVMITDQEGADDYVVATGETHSVREMCDVVFSYLDLDYRDYVVTNPKYLRPEEVQYLRGDSSKAQKTLGWEPTISFEDMMKEMVDHWLKELT